MTDTWRATLRDARKSLHITQPELASRVGVSAETIRSYETRDRRPSRDGLERLIAELKIPNAQANGIRKALGFPIVPSVFTSHRATHRYYSLEDLPAAVETVPWPEFAVDDSIQVVAANAAVQCVWQINFPHEQTVRSRAALNLLSVASDHHFTDRVKNWEECVGVLVSMFKSQDPKPYSLDEPNPYFSEVLAEFAKGDPAFLTRLFNVWAKTEPMEDKIRWTYPVAWEDLEFGEMRFLAAVSLANETAATFFNSWHPIDAQTWTVLDEVKRRGVPPFPPTSNI